MKLEAENVLLSPEILSDGRIRLYEKWQWLDDERSEGNSIIEEVLI